MKHESNNVLNIFENSETNEWSLSKENTKSIPDNEFKKEIKRIFSPADLWKIHRQRKNIYVRKYF